MKKRKIAYCCTFILAFFCCQVKSQQVANAGNTELGNKLIDAFYSFNKDTLALILSSAKSSQPDILYYQKWAECAHYKIIDRSHYFEKNDSLVVFPVTVKDDLMGALAIDFNVTDTFHIMIRKGKIISPAASDRMYRNLGRQYWDGEGLSQIPEYIKTGSKNGAINRSRSETIFVHAPHGEYVYSIITKNQKAQEQSILIKFIISAKQEPLKTCNGSRILTLT